ncbi:MAG: hypothetical protein EOO98_09720, partial [Pedobacter sp.]
MKFFTTLILLFILGKTQAQQINGQVLDYTSKLPVDNVVITYGKQTIITTATGKFSFQRNGSDETVQLNKLGYENYRLNLKNNFKDLTIYLKPIAINLNDVLV